MDYFGQKMKYTLEVTPFKKGGEGSVYNIVGKSDVVAKIYHSGVVTAELEAKIKYITNNPPAKSILNQIAWPQDYLTDASGKFVGFVMPKLKIDAELGDLYVYPAKKIKLTNEQKVVVAINICRVIAEIHKAGYVFGDFNPCNIGVNLTTGNVAFLDTDSYHIYDKITKHTYRCNVCLNGYVAPELIQKCKGTDYRTATLPTFTQETDRFSLAIHIFKLLFNGFTPYNGIDENERSSQASPGQGNIAIEKDNYCFKPGNKPMSMAVPPITAFSQELQDLFTRAFISGRNNPSLRPTAEEWDKALCNYRSSMVICTNNPLHCYYNQLQVCPYCDADNRYNVMLSVGSVYGSTGSVQQINFSNPIAVPVSSTSSNSKATYSSSSSAASSLGNSITKAKKQSKLGFRKKFAITMISILVLLLIGGGISGGLYYKNGVDAANETQELISYLPLGEVSNYSVYKDLIQEAYESYESLASWQKDRVENRGILLAIIPKYNEYIVETLRTTSGEVSEETVSTSSALTDTVKLYNGLNSEQKSLLSNEEIAKYENYKKVLEVINSIKEIDDDLVNKYDRITSVNRTYLSIDEEFQGLVYNYELIATFESKMEFLNQFTFTEIENGYSLNVKNGISFEGELILPCRYNNKDVIKIEKESFKDQRRVTAITVSENVQIIESGAFSGCNNLTELTLPFTGESLSSSTAFKHIFGGADVPQSLKKVTITNQNKVVDSVFSGCNHIETIVYKKTLNYIGASSFKGCEALFTFNSKTEGTINLSGNMDSIGARAFEDCASIQRIIFSDEILTINDYAFSGCRSIESLKLTNRITKIGAYAFQDLKQIQEIVVFNSTQQIGVGAFKNCNALHKIQLPFLGLSKTATNYNSVFGAIFGYVSEGYSGLSWDSGFKNTIYSNSPYSSGSAIRSDGAIWQFSYVHNNIVRDSYWYYIPTTLREVIITNQTDIPTAAFNGCSMLTNINITQGIESQGEYAFQNCTATIQDGTIKD